MPKDFGPDTHHRYQVRTLYERLQPYFGPQRHEEIMRRMLCLEDA